MKSRTTAKIPREKNQPLQKRLRAHSSLVVDGVERAASRAMLYAAGFKREDFKKAQIGVASTWSMVTPCNIHIDKLALEAEKGVNAAGGKGVIFGTITVSDGISMGTEGMKYSLMSREVIADSIETVMGCESFDGLVAIGGCDKNMPGCVMAMARLNRPSVFVYGGTILPGCITGAIAASRLNKERAAEIAGKKLDIVSVFEAVGAHANGEIGDRELELIEQHAIPGAGSCGGMYTANTMASAIEALGMSLPTVPPRNAISAAKLDDSRRAGRGCVTFVKTRHPPARHPHPVRRLKTRSPWSSPSAAPRMRCCTCSPSPTARA